MGGHGSFADPCIGVSVTQEPDLVTPKLPALLQYQLSLKTPPPPAGSFDPLAAKRGETIFKGKAGCATCHIPPTFTDVLQWPRRHRPLSSRSQRRGNRAGPRLPQRDEAVPDDTAPRVVAASAILHDGSAGDLAAVVDHYDTFFSLGLNARQKADLVEFLKTL